MSKLFAMIWKDTVLRFSGLSEWLFFLILPIVFTVILAGGTGDGGDQRARLLVVDEARSPLSAELLAHLGESGAVRPDSVSIEEAEDGFSKRQASALLVIPADFTTSTVLEGGAVLDLRKLPNNTGALAAEQAVDAAAARVGSALAIVDSSQAEAERIRPFKSEAERASFTGSVLEAARAELAAAPVRLVETQASTPDPINYDPQANSSAGQMITWVFIPLLGISGTFVYERQNGTLRRMLVTPTHKGLFLFAVIFGNVLLAVVQMLLLVGFGAFVMHIHWGNSPAALGALMFSSALAAAGIGTAMSAFIKTYGQANGLAIMTGMLMAMMGGCWYPIELFPEPVQAATKILPTRWAMQGMLDLSVRNLGFEAVLPEVAVLLVFAAVFFAIGVWRFRYE